MSYVAYDKRPASTEVMQYSALGAEDDPGLLERTTGLPTWALVTAGLGIFALWLLPKVEPGLHAARRVVQGREG